MATDISTIKITKRADTKINEVDFNNIPFGKIISDHMFTMNYVDGEWVNPEIIPYDNLSFSPAMSSLHYGQSIFEGLKAYKKDGKVFTFRAQDNFERMNISAERMCMPEIPVDLAMNGLRELLKIERDWIPENDTNSLYIRPFMFATDEYVGIRPSENYKFIIFCCPVGGYYTEPLNVKIETFYTRAASGGVGTVKCAGNYASSLYPAKKAKEEGYHQLIWTDAKEHKYIEESGTMNVMFVINDTLVTPKLDGTILHGITRRSILTLAREWGYKVEEREVLVEEIVAGLKNGAVKEAFGAGTAATIASIQVIGHEGTRYELPPVKDGVLTNKLYTFMNNLKRGKEEDKWGWIEQI